MIVETQEAIASGDSGLVKKLLYDGDDFTPVGGSFLAVNLGADLDSGAKTPAHKSGNFFFLSGPGGGGGGSPRLGIVKSPGTDGLGATYVVDIYGEDLESFADSDPSYSDQTVYQSPQAYYYRWGELVACSLIGSQWFISKFFSLPLAYTLSSGQVALRMVGNDVPGAGGSSSYPYMSPASPKWADMLVDVADLYEILDVEALWTASNMTVAAYPQPKYLSYDFNGYGGMSFLRADLLFPVPMLGESYATAIPLLASDFLNPADSSGFYTAAKSFFSPTPATLSSAWLGAHSIVQDATYGRWEGTDGSVWPNIAKFWDVYPWGNGSLSYISPSLTDLWPGETFPTIRFAKAATAAPLAVARAKAYQDPTIKAGWKSLLIDSDGVMPILGTYDVSADDTLVVS
jgi:hypothetical protein